MARYQVVIETRETAGGFVATLADAPDWLRKVSGNGIDSTAGSAYGQLALALRRRYAGKHTFDFLHVES